MTRHPASALRGHKPRSVRHMLPSIANMARLNHCVQDVMQFVHRRRGYANLSPQRRKKSVEAVEVSWTALLALSIILCCSTFDHPSSIAVRTH